MNVNFFFLLYLVLRCFFNCARWLWEGLSIDCCTIDCHPEQNSWTPQLYLMRNGEAGWETYLPDHLYVRIYHQVVYMHKPKQIQREAFINYWKITGQLSLKIKHMGHMSKNDTKHRNGVHWLSPRFPCNIYLWRIWACYKGVSWYQVQSNILKKVRRQK